MTGEVLYTCPDSINPHPDCDHPQRTTGDILLEGRMRAMVAQCISEADVERAAKLGWVFEPEGGRP